MSDETFEAKLGRIRDQPTGDAHRHSKQVARAGGRSSWSKGHVKPGDIKRGLAAGARIAAGFVPPGSRRVIVRARYSKITKGDLGAAKAHVNYILRDGTSRGG